MNSKNQKRFVELKVGNRIELPSGGYVEKKVFIDRYGCHINILTISNGLLMFTVILERGMDIGEIFLGEDKITWDRKDEYLIHPDKVDLYEKGGWDRGFYAAVAAIGPEIFGTPDEVRTVHGTGSYSKTDLQSVSILWNNEQICIEGTVPIRGYSTEPVYQKDIKIFTRYNSSLILRKDSTRNLTGEHQPLDDGYHIQLAGNYVSKGGRYVLPVSRDKMLLRDSAPGENNPFEIYEFNSSLDPIRCYQYIPEPVIGLEEAIELSDYLDTVQIKGKITAEMIVNSEKTKGAYVIRSLESFPRSLIAKRAIDEPMYALEPCRTRPNSIRQKAIDGELAYLESHGQADSWIIIGAAFSNSTIQLMEDLIEGAVK
ncbi:DUF4432 family protein [Clostridium sp. BNL1100]|uniref:DUF4432 family protein n=1 Tax=Clostridium sp. BNL1100 TaxID=755731 RepID=UPI0005A2376E|nr:DUF4432 family protein [Clostridium sp. BNL1100]